MPGKQQGRPLPSAGGTDTLREAEVVELRFPSGRIAEPREVAALAVFLLSDACAAMTGIG